MLVRIARLVVYAFVLNPCRNNSTSAPSMDRPSLDGPSMPTPSPPRLDKQPVDLPR